MRSLRVLLLAVFAAATVTSVPAARPEKMADGAAVVRAMHDRYATSWYKTLTFVQRTINYERDGTSKEETWYEALACPGRLRIDVTPVSNSEGILFADDTVYRIEGGKVTSSRKFVHPLLVLGFDVYCEPPERTVARLGEVGVDMTVVHDDTWEGRPVWVVGAKKGDEKTAQFWIDKERLYFVRMIRPAGENGAHTSDVQFAKYERAGGGWVAAEVLFMLDGTLTTKEVYSDIRADVALPDGLFDPERWTTVHWRE